MKGDPEDKSSALQGVCVLQVIPALDAGGAERTTVEIARGVVAVGGRSIVVSNGGRLESELDAIGAPHVRMPVHSKNPIEMALNARRLSNLIKAEQVDIAHARSRAPAWSVLAAARATGAAMVGTHHGAYNSATPIKRFLNSGIVRGDAVIANSEFTASRIRETYPSIARRVVAIARGADLERFDAGSISAARRHAVLSSWGLAAGDGAAPRRFALLLAARLTDWKGQRIAIDALRRAREKGPPAIADRLFLVLAGDHQGRARYMEELQLAIREAGLEEMVKLTGHCEDMPAAYLAADAALAPSTRAEAFGRAAVEAAAMGRIVIGSACGGLTETIEDGRTGFLTPPGDADALCDAILKVATMDDIARRDMEAAAEKRAKAHFSVESMVNATINLYRDLLASR